MELEALAGYLERLSAVSGRIEMAQIASQLLQEAEGDLELAVSFAQGKPFPPWDRRELGIAEKTMVKAIAKATGYSEAEVEKRVAKTGDTGLAAQELFGKKKQTTLGYRKLDLQEISAEFAKLVEMEGAGSAERKVKHVMDLLSNASAVEVKYLVRLLLGEMRLGVGEGVMREAVSQAFNVDAELAEKAYSMINDYGEVARIARDKGDKGLRGVSLRLFRPLKPMLAQSVHSVAEAIEAGCTAFEKKFDGMRSQIHVRGDKVQLFTRRLDEVTAQFPDVVEAVKKGVRCKECIIEGEVLAVEGDKPLPFQTLSRRIKRKYDIKGTAHGIPTRLFLFDCMLLDGENLLLAPFRNRRKALQSIIKEHASLSLSPQLVTKDAAAASAFYKQALEEGHEGVMCKNLDAEYKPGSRVGYMYKLKPVTESFDLVIVGAEWGEGRRAEWLGSFLLACRDPDTNELLEIGRMATGLTDEQLQYLTDTLKPDIMEQKGKSVRLRPNVVVEVGYQEIQKSPTYASGFALRFPRLIRLREDRGTDDCDSLDRVAELWERFVRKK
jgi:DNA ligase-1